MESNLAAFPRDRHAGLRLRISRWLVLVAAASLLGILACHFVGLDAEHPVAEQVNAWLVGVSALNILAVCVLARWATVARRRFLVAALQDYPQSSNEQH